MKDSVRNLINTQRRAVMGFAAIWIALYHLWSASGKHPVFRYLKGFGFAGVDLFFLLSGMGLVYAADKYGTLTFYRRRLDRVYLPYGITTVVFGLIEGWGLGLFLKNLLCISFYSDYVTIFLWFVPAILTLYLLFPLYYWLFRRIKYKGGLTLAAILLWLAASLLVPKVPDVDYYFLRTWMFLFTNRIPIFLTGIYLGWRLRERDLAFPWWGWGVLLLVLGLGIYGLELTYVQERHFIVRESFCFAPTYLIAISSVPLAARGAQLLERYGWLPGKWILKVLNLFGRISLEFYCVHEHVGEWIGDFLGEKVSVLTSNILMLAGSLAAALVLDVLCRGLRRATKHLRSRETAAV